MDSDSANEVKFVSSGFAIKFVSDGTNDMTFSGYGAFFNNVDSYGDTIAPGAFKSTIAGFKASGQWPSMLQQHGGWGMTSEDMMPIGIWTDIGEDDKGLVVSGRLADTTRGREAYNLLKMQPRPAINGLSIGYRAKDYSINSNPKSGEAIRTLKAIDLMEISLVTFPANDQARVSSVKRAGGIKTIREFEEFLRDEGKFSHAAARDIAHHGFKARSESRDENDGLKALAETIKRVTAAIAP